jgi:hypothetical protein
MARMYVLDLDGKLYYRQPDMQGSTFLPVAELGRHVVNIAFDEHCIYVITWLHIYRAQISSVVIGAWEQHPAFRADMRSLAVAGDLFGCTSRYWTMILEVLGALSELDRMS